MTGANMISVGTPIPNLDLLDSSGRPQRLRDQLGAGGLLVFFMRTASCPICNAHVRDLERHADELAARGVRVLLVVPERPDEAEAWRLRRGIPFPVVTGGSGTAHEEVGLTRRVFGVMRQSGTLLIDGTGIVQYALGSTLPTGAYDRTAIMRAVEALSPVDPMPDVDRETEERAPAAGSDS
ncbi:peroxiredoxin family protein [Agromyces sp. NPDC058126]|uniref:peroxiredoxin family protein n=1 Tax=Agromyces sp. NPDC058126 TaxID=3346350 RepID=UPI0036DEF855